MKVHPIFLLSTVKADGKLELRNFFNKLNQLEIQVLFLKAPLVHIPRAQAGK